jgi:two-component system cell cycle response regulator
MEILVVEDDASTAAMIEHGLRSLGFACQVVLSGRDAWRSLQLKHVDVVISDWVMEDMDGLELCRAIRERHERQHGTPYTYFVLLTSLTARESRLEAIRAGVDDYLMKPLDRHELLLRLIVADRVSRVHRRLEYQAEESARLNGRLHEAVRTDPLTRVGNRVRLDEDIETLGHGREAVAVALVDVDHFKDFNDRYLHLKGDEALQRIAASLRDTLAMTGCGPATQVYRFGGEEFVVLLAGADAARAVGVAEDIRAAVMMLAIPHEGAPEGVVTLSVGVATANKPGDACTPDTIRAAIRASDKALFDAKREGRNRVVAVPG